MKYEAGKTVYVRWRQPEGGQTLKVTAIGWKYAKIGGRYLVKHGSTHIENPGYRNYGEIFASHEAYVEEKGRREMWDAIRCVRELPAHVPTKLLAEFHQSVTKPPAPETANEEEDPECSSSA